jgi:Rod binding domain-containing protein
MDSVNGTSAASRQPERHPKLWGLARDMEATFLAEMMKSAGVGKPREVFGGGAGEDQFSSFLVQELAAATAGSGGIGLRESIYRSLVGQEETKP